MEKTGPNCIALAKIGLLPPFLSTYCIGGGITFGGRENPALEIRPLPLLRRAVYTTLCGTVMRPRWITVSFLLPGIKERGGGGGKKMGIRFVCDISEKAKKRRGEKDDFLFKFSHYIWIWSTRRTHTNKCAERSKNSDREDSPRNLLTTKDFPFKQRRGKKELTKFFEEKKFPILLTSASPRQVGAERTGRSRRRRNQPGKVR